jgi:two-component system response regulator HydG
MTAFGNIQTVVAALRARAYDFITKPVEVDDLVHTLSRAVQHYHLRDLTHPSRVDTPGTSFVGIRACPCCPRATG